MSRDAIRSSEGRSVVMTRTVPIGAASYETNGDREPAPKTSVTYVCPRGHRFVVPLCHDAERPETWECRAHGICAPLEMSSPGAPQQGRSRTHWDMLRERRSIAELENLLKERLAVLHGGTH